MKIQDTLKALILPVAFAVAVGIAALSARATGAINNNPNDNVPTNPSQYGALYPVATNGTQAAGYVVTNYFPYTFNVTPALILTTVAGNLVTNGVVTSTNFTFTSQNTNYPVYWQAYNPYPRVQSGTTAAGTTNITFPYPYVSTPVVTLGANTNAWLGTVTTTNFTVNVTVTNGATVNWISFGNAYTVGPNIISY